MRADLPPENEIWYSAVEQESNGSLRYLRGEAKLETSDMTITADEIDYNSDTDWATARGNVHLEHFATGDSLSADHAEYNVKTQEGKFYVVSGTAPAKIFSTPGVLTTTNPFYFQARWAERIKDRYILHKGFLTDCKMPKPWWKLESPLFDVIPGDRAIARHAVFRVRRLPILYLPIFYHPLGRNPRQSGFLTPNVGHSTFYGYMVGLGYYWAVTRSYDMTGILHYFTERGPALRYDFRGKPNDETDFNFNLYGVMDRGIQLRGTPFVAKEGGVEFEATATTQILGFTGRLDYNYLSSFLFREAFSNSFASSVGNQVYSIGFLQRHFDNDTYTVNILMERNQEFEAITYPYLRLSNGVVFSQVPNQVIIQKLPAIEFLGRDQQIANGPVPVWFSFGTSAGVLDRSEPTGVESPFGPATQVFQTGQVERIDMEPRVSTAFSFKGFSLTPSITFGATDYGNSYATNTTTYQPSNSCGISSCPPTPVVNVALANANLFRKDADFVLDFRPPSLERIYTPPSWLHLGKKLKHVIEAQATYEYVTGINQFQKILHFDATDILSNTNQLTLSITNRLYKKDSAGNVSEFLTWEVMQARYFDPTFGGAVLPLQRNVVLASEELTPFTFLDGPRDYSPVVSSLTLSLSTVFNTQWRAEYDPLRHKFIDSTYGVGAHYGKIGGSVGETSINTNTVLIPKADQLVFTGTYGNITRKGWNALALIDYDLLLHRPLFDVFNISYNTDCCGWSFQLRRYNLGIRDENQYLFSFSIANIGTFGSMQKRSFQF